MGAPDGLKGTDLTKGAGLAFLGLLHNPTGLGLNGATTFDTLTSMDLAWRDQDRIDAVDAYVASAFEMKLRNPGGNGGGIKGATIPNDKGWPYSIATATDGNFQDTSDGGASGLMFYPLVMPGHGVETSKLQSVKGSRDINIGYTAVPTNQQHLISCEFPVFDPSFSDGLKDLLLGGSTPSATLAPKTLNKQVGGVHGVGKLAYVRQKVSV
jgi:hypothetical protein